MYVNLGNLSKVLFLTDGLHFCCLGTSSYWNECWETNTRRYTRVVVVVTHQTEVARRSGEIISLKVVWSCFGMGTGITRFLCGFHLRIYCCTYAVGGFGKYTMVQHTATMYQIIQIGTRLGQISFWILDVIFPHQISF